MLLLLPLNEGFVCCGEVGTCFKQEKADFVKFWEVVYTLRHCHAERAKGNERTLQVPHVFSFFFYISLRGLTSLGSKEQAIMGRKKIKEKLLKNDLPAGKSPF